MTQHPALLTTTEVAAQLRVHPTTVRRWVEKDLLLPAVVTPGGQFRFTRESIAAFAGEPCEKAAS